MRRLPAEDVAPGDAEAPPGDETIVVRFGQPSGTGQSLFLRARAGVQSMQRPPAEQTSLKRRKIDTAVVVGAGDTGNKGESSLLETYECRPLSSKLKSSSKSEGSASKGSTPVPVCVRVRLERAAEAVRKVTFVADIPAAPLTELDSHVRRFYNFVRRITAAAAAAVSAPADDTQGNTSPRSRSGAAASGAVLDRPVAPQASQGSMNATLSPTPTPPATLREHYDEKARHSVASTRSANLGLHRKHMNLVKTFLLQQCCAWVRASVKRGEGQGPTPLHVVDVCCGHGQDLLKFQHVRIASYLGIDLSQVAVQRARGRYRQLQSETKARFQQAKERKKGKGKKAKDAKTGGEKEVLPLYPAQFVVEDALKVLDSVAAHWAKIDSESNPGSSSSSSGSAAGSASSVDASNRAPADVARPALISCQLGLHYLLSSQERCERFLRACARILPPGGVVSGTILNCGALHRALSSATTGVNGQTAGGEDGERCFDVRLLEGDDAWADADADADANKPDAGANGSAQPSPVGDVAGFFFSDDEDDSESGSDAESTGKKDGDVAGAKAGKEAAVGESPESSVLPSLPSRADFFNKWGLRYHFQLTEVLKGGKKSPSEGDEQSADAGNEGQGEKAPANANAKKQKSLISHPEYVIPWTEFARMCKEGVEIEMDRDDGEDGSAATGKATGKTGRTRVQFQPMLGNVPFERMMHTFAPNNATLCQQFGIRYPCPTRTAGTSAGAAGASSSAAGSSTSSPSPSAAGTAPRLDLSPAEKELFALYSVFALRRC